MARVKMGEHWVDDNLQNFFRTKKAWKAYLKATNIEYKKAKKAEKAVAEYKKARKRASALHKSGFLKRKN